MYLFLSRLQGDLDIDGGFPEAGQQEDGEDDNEVQESYINTA